MADKQSDSGFSDNAPGGRHNQAETEHDEGNNNNQGEVSNTVQQQGGQSSLQQMPNGLLDNRGEQGQRAIRGLTKREVEEVSGSLKIHVKLNLEVDLRVQASLNGDIVIGIL
ncbi:hypothetical protein PV05_04376 [Exophiala xenobiotica]|uniref:Uncharacterized protein n=1 Tax=Exophiala xenobiotica TaxID=348802 RepID=A0A0D2ELS8_9EURO|nr:uncharacterized protein PV05_04376 [Exophiala xenobiotica]KIW55645.1 hypothetical protein PV05_04376 [Exophiala xenobiotica]